MIKVDIQDVVEMFQELEDDPTVSKGVKIKIVAMREELENARNIGLTVNKILSDLEDISSDVNLSPYVRTQFWHITSVLENFS